MGERDYTAQFFVSSLDGTSAISLTAAVPQEVDGCDECNRTGTFAWPIYTVSYHGVEVCAKCLTPMNAKRRSR